LSAASSTPDCPICDDAPGHHWLWRDDRLRVIDARDPDHPAFLRVVWNDHAREMTDLNDADREHLMHVVWQVERSVREIAQPEKINLGSLGNMVPHLHWHVIARWQDDVHFPGSVWSTRLRDGVARPRLPTALWRATLLARLGLPTVDIPAALAEAYEATAYAADLPDGPATLRIGTAEPLLDRWLAARSQHRWALISAANPWSVRCGGDANLAAHAALRALLVQRGLPVCEAVNWPEDGAAGWTEPALLCGGLTAEEAVRIGAAFGQNAVLAGEAGETARLLWCVRADSKG
jgi:diadenosine tetraphosphate (Ap4A) HIT family hydrolase